MNDYPAIRRRMFEVSLRDHHIKTDRLFFGLLVGQWTFAVALTVALSPFSWQAQLEAPPPHLLLALGLGAVVNSLPLILIRYRPGATLTRHTIAVAQVLWSSILIHLTGGRIETHFHIFGSLAFLAFYRDWRLLVTATCVVTLDHSLRGLLMPQSIYGLTNPEWWRSLEHAGWVLFEDAVLTLGCSRAVGEMKLAADREVALEIANDDVEERIEQRTSELNLAHQRLADELKARLQTESELRQAQKLESVGRLASGVAHEINTPVQFVSDSIHFLKDAIGDFSKVIHKLQIVRQAVVDGETALAAAQESVDEDEELDMPYLVENVPKALDRALEGLSRVATIVRSMKEFAHPDSGEMTTVDLNRAIESTLTIARNEYKYVAELVTELSELSPVLCHAGEFNQVVLNIVVNAAHAIDDVVRGTDQKGCITVRTRQEAEHVVVTISDTGKGIPPEVRHQIFDPFFTTKEVGKGTGQGLAIAHSVIVDKHKGELSFESEVGAGTTFIIRLPISGCAQHAAA